MFATSPSNRTTSLSALIDAVDTSERERVEERRPVRDLDTAQRVRRIRPNRQVRPKRRSSWNKHRPNLTPVLTETEMSRPIGRQLDDDRSVERHTEIEPPVSEVAVEDNLDWRPDDDRATELSGETDLQTVSPRHLHEVRNPPRRTDLSDDKLLSP